MSAAASKPKRQRRPVRPEFEAQKRARVSARLPGRPPSPPVGSAATDDPAADLWEPHRGPFPGDRAG